MPRLRALAYSPFVRIFLRGVHVHLAQVRDIPILQQFPTTSLPRDPDDRHARIEAPPDRHRERGTDAPVFQQSLHEQPDPGAVADDQHVRRGSPHYRFIPPLHRTLLYTLRTFRLLYLPSVFVFHDISYVFPPDATLKVAHILFRPVT